MTDLMKTVKEKKGKVVTVNAMMAQSRGREANSLILNLSTRWKWVVNITPRPLYSQERTPDQNEQEAGWAPGDRPDVLEKRKDYCLCRDSNPG